MSLIEALPELPFSFPRSDPEKTWSEILNLEELLTKDEVKAIAAVPGNTAKAHGRSFSSWMFFRFRDETPATDKRAGLVQFIRACRAHRWHTSLLEQLVQWQDYKKQLRQAKGLLPPEVPVATQPFGSIMLTHASFEILGGAEDFLGIDAAFRKGMMPTRDELFDRETPATSVNPGDEWDGYGFEREFDVALFLARSSRKGCDELVSLAAQVATLCGLEWVHRENGFIWRPEGEDTGMREPFGFRDGISNLLFLDSDVAAFRAMNTAVGESAWNPVCRWQNVLLTDGPEDLQGGSFVVLRKLEQNVAAFRAWESSLSKPSEPLVDGASRFVGRSRDGCPMTGLPSSGRLNDFDFSRDRRAQACPFHSHIRKANPRGTSNDPIERSRLFVRRGMVYATGDELALHERPAGNVGLLFTGYMGRIERQFLHMQAGWLHNPNFPGANGDQRDVVSAQGWQMKTQNFVTARGGGYFFAPPIPWVESLA